MKEIKEHPKSLLNPAIKLLVIGILLAFNDLELGILSSYGIEHQQAEGGNTFMYRQFLLYVMGYGVHINFPFLLVGCILVSVACVMLRKYYKGLRLAAVGCVVALVAQIMVSLCPYFVPEKYLLKTGVISIIVGLLSQCFVMYRIYLAAKKQVDSFKQMEVRKDLYFGFETWALCVVVKEVVTIMQFFDLAVVIYWILWIGQHVALIYFVYKLVKYCKLYSMFVNKDTVEKKHIA